MKGRRLNNDSHKKAPAFAGARVQSATGSAGASQVERHVAGGAEIDRNALGVIRVHREARRGHHDVAANRTAQRFRQRTTRVHCINVELDGRTSLTTLNHVSHDAVRHCSVGVSEIHRGISIGISKRGLILAERSELTVGYTDRRNVDFSPGNFQAPLPHLGHRTEGLVSDRSQTATKVAGGRRSSYSSATNSAADRHDPSGGIVGFHEVIASRDSVRGGSASGIGQGDRVINQESIEVANSDVGASRRKSGSGKTGSGIGRLVPKRARSARQYRGFTGHGP